MEGGGGRKGEEGGDGDACPVTRPKRRGHPPKDCCRDLPGGDVRNGGGALAAGFAVDQPAASFASSPPASPRALPSALRPRGPAATRHRQPAFALATGDPR